ncbi:MULTISPECIES: bacterio-opsin activator domain-containing protein [Salinibaculum]|uniref:bacterio-opsin activator domain-containing protein n=1 Tax=Salinibaculum TaxID=2732368 RepID=UPI0030D43862
MDTRDSALAETVDEVLPVFESGGAEPYSSREVADELGCARTTAYKKLQRLAEAGVLETKKVGAKARVWWLPPEEPTPRSGTGAEDERTGSRADADASEQQFRAAFEAAFDAMMIADDEGRYVEVNPAASDLFGVPEEELLGRTIAEFAADGYDFEEAWRDFQESNLDRGLFPLVRPDGEHRTVEFAATPNILPGRHLSVIRDVTERREAKEQLAEERERSERYLQTLAAEVVIELEIRLDDEDFLFNDLSAALDCRCAFEGMVPTADRGFLQYIEVAGPDSEEAKQRIAASPQVSDSRVVFESDTACVLELVMDRSPLQKLVELGASGRSMHSEGGATTVVAEVGADASMQDLINRFTAAYPAATVTAKRTLDRPVVTTKQYRDSLGDSVTERQLEVLRAAYLGGYYEWPRNSTAEDVASSMGIAASTWLRHLRLAESKLVTWVFEELDF